MFNAVSCSLALFAGVTNAICFSAPPEFDSPARLRRTFEKSTQGTLAIEGDAVSFRSPKFSVRWPYSEIKTFDLHGNRELTITDYQNRRWHEPGERRFRFTLARPIPPELAAALASRIGRPARNGDPDVKSPAFAGIAAHRKELFAASNGELRFRDAGIDYVTPNGAHSRTWRWSDIETIASPNPWEFRITAYRETAEFELKQPLSRELFDSLWDLLYARDLNLATRKEAAT
ncbi:MAG TPA: hypothetical protein VG345_03125, partial [Bryobacteraceae bacterium]|nr:hypothetical protein [Bryobacteraceae bacterium]